MDPNIKKNKNSALIPQYTHKFCSGAARGHIAIYRYIKTDIYELLSIFAV